MGQLAAGTDDSNTQTTKIIKSGSRIDPDKKGQRRPPSLVLTKGPVNLMGKSWVLNKKSITIGRYSTSEIQISEKSLSKVHARITVGEGIVSLADLGATNGTSINGKILKPYSTYQLRNNDLIKMGGVVFTFVDDSEV